MATYQITINERTQIGKNIVAQLKSITGVVQFERTIALRKSKKHQFYINIADAMQEVKAIEEGKEKACLLEDFINELPDYCD